MSKLGYTWYPQDWWTSETYKRLKRYPMVRYAIRELFDLMYKEEGPVEMSRDYLYDDFNIALSDEEYSKLMEYVQVLENGKWWITSIRKRISRSESSRENGKKGGRPKKTQKPKTETQSNNLKNPPLEIEREIESKIEIENKVNNNIEINFDDADNKKFRDVLKFESQQWLESVSMQQKKSPDFIKEKLDEFTIFLFNSQKSHSQKIEFIRHFINWLPKKIQDNGESKKPGHSGTKKQYRFSSAEAIKTATGENT